MAEESVPPKEQEINPKTGLPYKTPAAIREKNKRSFEKNREKRLEGSKKWREKNRDKCLKNAQKWAEKNREKSNAIKQAWKERNREKYLAQQREYAKSRTHITRELLKEWRRKNNARFRESTNKWRNERRKLDPKFRAECMWRVIFGSYIWRDSGRKSKYLSVFGLTPEKFREHIQDQFLDGMTWENHWDVWQIDHIIPLSKFDMRDSEQVKICMHFSNTRPLWSAENASRKEGF